MNDHPGDGGRHICLQVSRSPYSASSTVYHVPLIGYSTVNPAPLPPVEGHHDPPAPLSWLILTELTISDSLAWAFCCLRPYPLAALTAC